MIFPKLFVSLLPLASNRVVMEDKFVIALSDLRSGVTEFEWNVGKEFFEEFENEQIRSAGLQARARVQKNASSVLVDLELGGSLTVPCDRCLEDVSLDVDASAALKIRIGVDPDPENDEEDGRELVCMPAGEDDFDFAQLIYDYACLSLPLQCCHPEGMCNPLAERYLNPSGTAGREEDSPFAALKGIFDNESKNLKL